MSDKKIIAVVGATGAQGGGLVRAIVADKDSPFVARAITRNVSSDKAKALSALGVEVVAADADDEKSMVKAFRGAYGAFCVTNFWEHLSPEREIAQATAMAKAAKAAGRAARDLVDAGGQPPVHSAQRRPDADAARQVESAALRRQGGRGSGIPRRRACRRRSC